MDVVLRYNVKSIGADQELTEKDKANPTVHKFSRTTMLTACGHTVPEGDRRWKVNRSGDEKDVTCVRCLKKMAPVQPKVKATTKAKGKSKKGGQSEPEDLPPAAPADKWVETGEPDAPVTAAEPMTSPDAEPVKIDETVTAPETVEA